MSQSNSKPQLAVPYLAKTDGRSRKFPKGTKVIVLWRGTTDYGECARVISEEEFIKYHAYSEHPIPRTVFLNPDRIKDVLVIGQETELPTIEGYKERLIKMGLLNDAPDGDNPVLFYGKIKQETDKAFLIDLADLIEPEWFAKSIITQRGKLTDRDQHGFEAPLWLLKKKVGEVKAKMFADCRSAIERRLVT
jgi:hypothetical protein